VELKGVADTLIGAPGVIQELPPPGVVNKTVTSADLVPLQLVLAYTLRK
jgi:hypothetical protein